jgi:hypothetical protein
MLGNQLVTSECSDGAGMPSTSGGGIWTGTSLLTVTVSPAFADTQALAIAER